MKQKFIEWFTKNNNGCSPAMAEDGSFEREKTQHMFEAYQAGVAEGEARCAALAAENGVLLAIMNEQAGSFGAALAEGFHDAVMESGSDQLIDIYQRRLQPAIQCIPPTTSTDAFLAEVRAQGVGEFLRGSQLPYQIATVLADYDNVDDATLQTVIWSGQPPEPDGDVWHIEYVSRGNAIVRAVLKELRKGVQS